MAAHRMADMGNIDISEDVIATIAGTAALECYGLVGMASRRQIKDGIAELLGRENLRKGIEVHKADTGVALDVHIIVSYGTKISEVAHNVQMKIKYVLKETIGLSVHTVNVFVQGVRVTNE